MKINRKIEWVVIHCTDADVEGQTVEMVRSWQVDPRFNGGNPLADIAYHFLIRTDGLIEPGRPLESPGAGEPGYNKTGIHVCLAGKEVFEKVQIEALENLLLVLHTVHPEAKLVSHKEINKGAPKTCPNFDLEPLKALWRSWKESGRVT